MAVVAVGVVLRFWALGHGYLSVDESYTALASRMPVGDLWTHIDRTDPHPPLSYLLFHPVASTTTDLSALRFLGALASSAAVVVCAVWQRHKGVAGVVATAVLASSSYQLFYGRQMRMYGFLVLFGVVVAWACERWLSDGGRRWAALAAVAGTACAFSHASGIILLAALLAIPALRRDGEAWRFRAFTAAGLGLFALVWVGHTLAWRDRPSQYPAASLSWLATVVNETVAPVPSNRWLVVPLLVAGAAVILGRAEPTRWVWLVLGVGPVAALYVLSLDQGILVPKSLMMVAWAPALALGAVVGAAWRRSAPFGVAAAVLVALLVVPYTSRGIRDEGAGNMIEALEARVEPGDAVAVRRQQDDIRDLVEWYRYVAPGVSPEFDNTSVPDHRLVRTQGQEPSGRIWFVTSGSPYQIEGTRPCGPAEEVGGSYVVQCLETSRP